MLNEIRVALRAIGVSAASLLLWGQLERSVLSQNAIQPDSTLSNESSLIETQINNGVSNTLIEGGATRGDNLFHSFEEFNVSENGGAYFIVGNSDIANIFSRITGNEPSEILGVLGTRTDRGGQFLSSADLYFMNPNGVMFGPNARLSLGGSLAVTTADHAPIW